MGQEHLYDYTVFTNSRMSGNYFFSKTVQHAPSEIENIQGRLPVEEKYFSSPGNSLRLAYVNGKNGNWNARIFKESIRGQDHFKFPKYFAFRILCRNARDQRGLPQFSWIFSDSSLSQGFPITPPALNQWTTIEIPVENSAEGHLFPQDVIGIEFSQHADDGGSHCFYVDDIGFLPPSWGEAVQDRPHLSGAEAGPRHVDLTWNPVKDSAVRFVKIYRSENGRDFTAVGIQLPIINRYADFTGVANKQYFYKITFVDEQFRETIPSNLVSAKTHPMNDPEFLTMIQKACFRYYWDGAEKVSGLAREDIPGRTDMVAAGASGFGIMALIVGTERNFITREQSLQRFLKITDFLVHAEKFHGAFSHFIDGPTGKVVPFFGNRDDGGDLVETSFLLQGLLTARAYFHGKDPREKLIRDRITQIWKGIEWDWYRRYPDSKYLYWHWSPDKAWILNHRLTGWNETMVAYLLAIASPTHSVPASLYYSGWANQDSTGIRYRMNWGGTTDGDRYTNGHTYFGIPLAVGVSDGGPLFFTHYSYMGYDPHLITDRYTNYFINNQHIAQINYRYCVKNPHHFPGYGKDCWGLTASDGPYHYSAEEPVASRDEGRIAPTGAVSSFPYTPEASMRALKNYYYHYGKFLWGTYGFRDAFNLGQNWCSGIYMGLNQAPMVVMIENYRTGLIWKLLASDPDIKNGLKKLELETKREISR